jgi:disulfide bond formation protein DsbB
VEALIRRATEPRAATALILAAAVATVGAALFFQHVIGLVPCKLCLIQRQPYYAAIPLALALLLLPISDGWRRLGLAALALVFLVSAGLGAYHAGVEWGFFLGPSDCGGGAPPAASGVGDFLKQLETTRVVSCTEAAWRFLGLSMAGWNAVVSLGLAAFAGAAAFAGGRYGSSSVSQYR